MPEFFDLYYPKSNTVLPGSQMVVLGWCGNPASNYLAIIVDPRGQPLFGAPVDTRAFKDPHWRSFHFDLSRYVDSREVLELHILAVNGSSTEPVASATTLVFAPDADHIKPGQGGASVQLTPSNFSSIDITYPGDGTAHDNALFTSGGTFSPSTNKAATATLSGTGQNIQSTPVNTRTGSFTAVFFNVPELYQDPANLDLYTLTVTGNVSGSDTVSDLDIHSRH